MYRPIKNEPRQPDGRERKRRDAGREKRDDSDRISLCRDVAPGNQINASRQKSSPLLHRSFRRRSHIRTGFFFVPQFPERYQAAESATLLLGFVGHVTGRLLLLVKFASLRMRATNQFGQTGQARPLVGIRLAGASVNSRREGRGTVSRQASPREERSREAVHGIGRGRCAAREGRDILNRSVGVGVL